MTSAPATPSSPCTVHAIDDVERYAGPGEIPGISFSAVGRALGVTAWGMNVLDLDAGATGYPAHDHIADGQEETYFVLGGSVTLVAGDERLALKAGDVARVPPEVTRTFEVGPDGARLLAIGGTPGQAFKSMIPGT